MATYQLVESNRVGRLVRYAAAEVSNINGDQNHKIQFPSEMRSARLVQVVLLVHSIDTVVSNHYLEHVELKINSGGVSGALMYMEVEPWSKSGDGNQLYAKFNLIDNNIGVDALDTYQVAFSEVDTAGSPTADMVIWALLLENE